MSKRRQEEIKPGLPEWMGTYGDMVTLLLTFFILLFAMSTLDAQKFQALANSLTGALGVSPGGTNISVSDAVGGGLTQLPDTSQIQKESPSNPNTGGDLVTKNMKKLYEELKASINQHGIISSTEIKNLGTVILIRFKDNVLFDSGSANIRPQALPVLQSMGSILHKTEKVEIRVEGHTDNRPISTSKFPSNWELSSSRALNILHFFIKSTKIDPTVLSAVGRGEYRAIASNATEEGRSRNRRVEIIIEHINTKK